MRDPARIPVMLVALGELWAKNPDWRLGQLLVNAADRPDLGSLFYMEDDQLLQGIIVLHERAVAEAADEQHGDPQGQATDAAGGQPREA